MVIADTSVWIPFFIRPASREKHALDALIDADELVLVGVVLAELLQGCRSREERDDLKDVLLALPYLEATKSTWGAAGELSCSLLRRGVTLPMSDVLIASLALEHNCAVYSLDGDFRKIPELARYDPGHS